MTRIYCVEDDSSIRELIVYTLNASDFCGTEFELLSLLMPNKRTV